MFSSIKMEEYMESELSGIFRVKLATKNIKRGSPGTQFMLMRVKTEGHMDFSNAYSVLLVFTFYPSVLVEILPISFFVAQFNTI